MIRQAIWCDICGVEKKQTNHWFVAYEQGGELRVSGWNPRRRPRPDSKHLCGQACFHKMMDEFMMKVIGEKVALERKQHSEEDDLESFAPACVLPPVANENDRPSGSIAPSPPLGSKPATCPPAELVAIARKGPGGELAAPLDEPRYSTRHWRAEAWERERERELRAAERRPDIAGRRSQA